MLSWEVLAMGQPVFQTWLEFSRDPGPSPLAGPGTQRSPSLGCQRLPRLSREPGANFGGSSVAGMQLDSCSAHLCQGMGMLARVAFPFLPAVIVTLHALFLVVSIGTMALGRAGKVWSH